MKKRYAVPLTMVTLEFAQHMFEEHGIILVIDADRATGQCSEE
ncbi:hypothetical protein [Rahnella rivi]|nr:hypothetical protein [Rahnella rivi]